MRFSKYINESSFKEDMSIDEINEMIHKDCKYYFNLIQNKWLFSRGLKSVQDIFGIKNVRTDRRPRATNKDAYVSFNEWLQRKGHVRRDKAIMATSSKGLERNFNSMFGDLYYIFPIGKFNYTWLEASDLNMYDNTGWEDNSVESFFNDGHDNTEKGFDSYFHTNKDINIAWKNKYEIWFDCKKYYFFKHSKFEYTWKSNKLILKQLLR